MAERDLTQSALAAKMFGRSLDGQGKLSANHRDRLSIWANGLSLPSREHAVKLATVLGVPVRDLVPEAERKAGLPGWSIASSRDGLAFVRIAQAVPADIAHEIHGLLLRAEQELADRPLKPQIRARAGGK
jgi:transcriptional regulator with XRE-family HTH domain